MNDTAIVLLTWQRLGNLRNTLRALENQTYSKFDIYVSNANIKYLEKVNEIVKLFDGRLDVWVSHDGNDLYAFRRLPLGRMLAEAGYEKILFIDDDISIPKDYVKNVIRQYEPKTYKSGFAWKLFSGGADYYTDRERTWNKKDVVQYCGTGISIIDSSFFLEEGIMKAPSGALKVEDLWMSYYVDHVLKSKGWRMAYMDTPGIIIGGADRVALYRAISQGSYTKRDLLHELVALGWKL